MSKLGLGWIVFVLALSSLSVAQNTFSPEALQQDFAFVVQTIRDVHPDPYTKVSKENLENLQTQIEAELTEPLTAATCCRTVKPWRRTRNELFCRVSVNRLPNRRTDKSGTKSNYKDK